MLPVVFRIPEWIPLLGGQPITSFGVLLLLAVLAGGAWLVRALARHGVEHAAAWDLVVVSVVGGLVGARLLYVVMHPSTLDAGLWAVVSARSGLDGLGALLGAGAAGAWRVARLGVRRLDLADAAAPGLALAYGIGRIGSFLAGTDYGRPTASWLGVAFRRGAPPTTPTNLAEQFGVDASLSTMVRDHVLVHPTQLYEAAAAFLVFAALVRWVPDGRGLRAGLFLALVGFVRFAIDFLRLRTDRVLGPLTLDQPLALLLTLAGLALVWRALVRAETEEPC